MPGAVDGEDAPSESVSGLEELERDAGRCQPASHIEPGDSAAEHGDLGAACHRSLSYARKELRKVECLSYGRLPIFCPFAQAVSGREMGSDRARVSCRRP